MLPYRVYNHLLLAIKNSIKLRTRKHKECKENNHENYRKLDKRKTLLGEIQVIQQQHAKYHLYTLV